MSQPDHVDPASDRESDAFARRHIAPRPDGLAAMLAVIGVDSLETLIDETVPSPIRCDVTPAGPALLDLPAARTEPEVLAALREMAAENRPRTSLIGMGYYGTHTPGVIQRNVLEDPAWYTAYTPYQPEISQGRLEALLNFQTDDRRAHRPGGGQRLAARRGDGRRGSDEHGAPPVGVASRRASSSITTPTRRRSPCCGRAPNRSASSWWSATWTTLVDGCFGALFSLPTSTGAIADWRGAIAEVHAADGIAVVATDLLACTLVTPPGELGADIAVGSAQRFGVPMGFGGPHAAFIAAHAIAARAMPGRIVGVSKDDRGRPALRLALQTREQHIRRDKATSNICTAQVLLANIAGLYACWHGPDGLTAIADRVHGLAARLAGALVSSGHSLRHASAFDTITVDGVDADAVIAAGAELGVDLRRVGASAVGVSFDETSTPDVVDHAAKAFGVGAPATGEADVIPIPPELRRTASFMAQSVFHRFHTEHEMLRYLRRLADRDLALDRTMIPLGSCTMKLNATTEMASITWPEFADLHPFAPADESRGTRRLIAELERWLAEITGYAAVSVQPNAGSQGELAGLLAIRAYHHSRGEHQRTVCLIPSSAHGTNAASAVMTGFQVVVVTDGRRR